MDHRGCPLCLLHMHLFVVKFHSTAGLNIGVEVRMVFVTKLLFMLPFCTISLKCLIIMTSFHLHSITTCEGLTERSPGSVVTNL